MLYSLLRSLKCRQVGQVQLNVAVNGTAATPVASGPDASFVLSVVDGGVGLYTVNFKESAKLAPFVTGLVPLTTGVIGYVTAVTVSSITVQFKNAAGAATDSDFNVQCQFSEQLSYYF